MSSDSGTRVDFYKLSGQQTNVQRFCCRLAEKALKLNHKIIVRVANAHDAHTLDNLMWSYSDGSFLPHARWGDQYSADSPVLIATIEDADNANAEYSDLLINLGHDVPDNCDHYQRIAEIINDDDDIKKHGRLRYSHYDKNNYQLQYHEIKS